MHLRVADYVLWFASPLLQAGVLVTMLRRGLHRDYPYFLNYTILAIISEPILWVLYGRSYTAYYYGYYVNLGLSVVISFAVLQEIFKDAFRPYEALRDLGVILFRWSALVVLLVGVMWAINAGHKSENGSVTDVILLADRSVRIMQCGLVFFLLLFSEYLGLSRRSFLFGVSLGFGLFAAVNMLVFTGLAHSGVLRQSTLSQINSAAYLAAVLIWFGYTLAAAPSESMVAEERLARSRHWDSALEDARVPVGADSLLDTMDRTVERLLHPPPPEEAKIKVSVGRG
jgi:hypothetical protein